MRVDLVLVKLGAVFIFVYALQSLAQYMNYWVAPGVDLKIVAMSFVMVFVFPALIAWVLWKFPATSIGAPYRIEASDSQQSDKSDANQGQSDATERGLVIGVSLIGLYTLVFGVIDLIYIEAQRFAELRLAEYTEYPDFPMNPHVLAGRVVNIVQIIFGFALIQGRFNIAAFLRKVRSAGIRGS